MRYISDLSNRPPCSVGATRTQTDVDALVTHAFLTQVRHSEIKLPWETGFGKLLFDDSSIPKSDFSLPSMWKDPGPEVFASTASGSSTGMRDVTSTVFAKCVKNLAEKDFLAMRADLMRKAILKCLSFLDCAFECSAVGAQIKASPGEEFEILASVMGTKSPNTIMKRMSALLAYKRWYVLNFEDNWIPFVEEKCWSYVRMLQTTEAAPSKATSFIQAVRFCQHILGVEGAILSRRIVGNAEIQLSNKQIIKQARPLSVNEVRQLQSVASDHSRHVVDRVIASHLLLMVFGRARHSDTLHIEEIKHDEAGLGGYLEVTTRCHKGAKSAIKKSWLLPILMPRSGVCSEPWVNPWIDARQEAGLPVKGVLNGCLMPAPSGSSKLAWTKRPLTCSELTRSLRSLVDKDDDLFLTSHSCKATCLAWCSRGEISREHRRLLGRHSSTLQDSDSFYARDLLYAPVRSLERILAAIRNQSFDPDGERSSFFPGTPLPGIMTPVAPLMAPGIPGAPLGVQSSPPECEIQKVKAEIIPSSSLASTEIIDVSSSSSSAGDSSTSQDDETSSDDETKGRQIANTSPQPFSGALLVKNLKSRVVHEVDRSTLPSGQLDDSVFGKAESLTACGRSVDKRFSAIAECANWTFLCRVCFKGRRDPGAGSHR